MERTINKGIVWFVGALIIADILLNGDIAVQLNKVWFGFLTSFAKLAAGRQA